MQTAREYFSKLTVVELRDRLKDFNFVGVSKSRKAELVNILLVVMDGAHTDAEAYAAQREADMIESVEAMVSEAFPPSVAEIDADYRKTLLGKVANGALAAERMVSRVNGYMRSNGTDKLTKPQLRRIRKNANRHGINPWRLSYDYSF